MQVSILEQQYREYNNLLELLDDLDKEEIHGVMRKRLVEEFLFSQAKKNRIPCFGGFELTPLCNFDCKMCYVHLNKEQMAHEHELLTTKQWIDIMRQAVDAGMMYADITGGECLTYPGFKDIYLYLVSRGVRVSILTNGSLLTEDVVSFLAQYRPEIIQVSVYGSSGEAYRRVTGYDAFDSVMKAIERLKKAGIRAKLSISPNRYLKEDAQALLEHVRTLGVEYELGSVTLPARPDTGRNMMEYAADSELFADMQINEELYKLRVREQIPSQQIQKFRVSAKGLYYEGGVPCGSARNGFHINWKGEMIPCIPFYQVKRSVFEHGFMAAWNGIGEEMKTYMAPDECKECDLRMKCHPCPAEKTLGRLDGRLNTMVCDRLRCVLEKSRQMS